MLDESRKFSVPRGSPSPCVHSGQVPILPLHLALPRKGDGGGTGFETHLGFLAGKVGTEQAVMTVLRRPLALSFPAKSPLCINYLITCPSPVPRSEK